MAIETDEQLRRIYGDEAVISRVDRYVLVHLDNPTPEQVATRNQEFDPNDFFFDDCPLCEMAKRDGGHIVFDGTEES